MSFPKPHLRRRLLAASALCAGAAQLATASPLESLEFSGSLETHTAIEFSGIKFQTNMITISPEVSLDIGATSRLTVVGRLNVDLNDRLEPGQPPSFNRAVLSRRLFFGDDLNAEIREAYLDTEIGSAFVRLGKQQIVWGQADGLKLLDVLNPQTFREFVLPEFEDSRIPLWSMNAEIPVRDLTLQLVWIPDTTYDDIPVQGSTFAFTSPLIVPKLPEHAQVVFNPVDKPTSALTDSDFGVRLAGFSGGWDFSLNYAYHYFDRPVLRRTLQEKFVELDQQYERTHLIGGSFSNVFGDFTLRGEVGYSTNRYFLTTSFADVDGVVRSNDASYVLGLDYAGISDWFFSAQLFQSFLSNHQDDLVRSKVDTTLTLLARRNFMNEALSAEALLIQGLSDGDGLLQLSAEYEWRSNVRLKAGADIFYGSRAGLFGQFSDADRISVGVEFAF